MEMLMNCRLFMLATAVILATSSAQSLPPTAVNLLCDGDFEAYKLAPTHMNYVFLTSNYSCWYNKIGGPVEIQYRLTPYNTTTICELVHYFQYILCQNLTLSPFKKYQLNFTVYNQNTMTFTTIILLINGVNNFNHTTLNQRNTTNASYQFWTTSAVNQVCFDSVFGSTYTLAVLGPCLDNITLVKLSPDEDLYSVFCDTNINELNWQVSVDCHFSNSVVEYYLNLLQNSIKFYADGKQLTNSEITDLSSTSIKFKITFNSFWLDLNNITIQIDDSKNVSIPVPQLQFYVNGRPVTVITMASQENNMMKSMSTISETILSTTEKVYLVLKSCVASYLLINIINFWNLSLMYNVLNISTIPAFSKYFLEKLTFLFFNLNSLSEWAEENIPALKNRLRFEEMEGREFIDDTKNKYAWFGSFGISSNFIKNNFETLFLILLMIIKILFVLLLRKIPPLQKMLPQRSKLLKIFLLQVISMETFMVMSAAASLFNLNSMNNKQKLNNFLQIMNAFICLMVVAGYFIISIKVSVEKKLQKWKKTHRVDQILVHKQANPKACIQFSKKLSKHRNRARVTEFNTIFELIPIIIVPSLIIINNPPIFLLVTSLILLHRLYYFRKNVGQFLCKSDGKIFDGFNILCWFLLHVCYVVLWVLEKIIQARGGLKGAMRNNVYTCIKIIGFVIVFTVLIGGLFQILRFFIQFLKLIFKLLKMIIKKYKKYGKIEPEVYQGSSLGTKHNNQKISTLGRVQKVNSVLPLSGVDNYVHSFYSNKVKITIIKSQDYHRQKQLKLQKSRRRA